MGFQSCSRKMTVSAAVRFRPSPPTWVVSSSTSMVGSLLKRCTILKRFLASTLQAASSSGTAERDAASGAWMCVKSKGSENDTEP